jgi:pimeloyl-ACP methyl ester carboxylesterase
MSRGWAKSPPYEAFDTKNNLPFSPLSPMQETVIQFGPDQGLLGILTTPADSVRVADAPIAVVINAGIVHRIGPFGLHVKMARQLAEAGFSTLRLDLSGLGDSLPRTEKLAGQNRAVLDVTDALDFLQANHNRDRFVVIGLCSGAFNAHQVAVKDDRIVGAVFIDGIVFRTLGYFWRHTVGRLLKPRTYRNALKRRKLAKAQQWINEDAGAELAESEFFFADDIQQSEITDDLRQLKERDVSMLFLYTDGYDDVCGRSQFREMYGMTPDDQIQVDYFPTSEHTFRIVENRIAACTRITDWFGGRFGGSQIEANQQAKKELV